MLSVKLLVVNVDSSGLVIVMLQEAYLYLYRSILLYQSSTSGLTLDYALYNRYLSITISAEASKVCFCCVCCMISICIIFKILNSTLSNAQTVKYSRVIAYDE